MKNLKTIITENKALIGAGISMACWYTFCYLAGKATSSLVKEHFQKHPTTSKGKVAVATVAAVAGAACLANFLGDLVGESIVRNFFKEPKKLEVIKNDPEEDLDDMDDFEVV